jgi:hypothetical protein
MMRTYKVTVFNGTVKATYKGQFKSIIQAASYYEDHFRCEVIEVKALNVRFKKAETCKHETLMGSEFCLKCGECVD